MNKGVLATLCGLGMLALATGVSADSMDKLKGKPAVKEGSKVAALGWQDGHGGLHFRMTTKYRKHKAYKVTGSVCAVGKPKISHMKPVLLEKRQDWAKIGPHGHCIWFGFHTNGHIDGFDFTTPGKLLRLDLKVDGKHLSPSKIYLGAKGIHPANNPGLVYR